MLKTLPRKKIRDHAAEQIKEFIVSRRLEPGDRLPTETEFAETFGVSRLSVREATKALEFLGIVESKPGVGLTVGRMDLGRMTEHLGFHPSLYGADPRQLIDTRIVIETGALPHVARQMAGDGEIHGRLQEWVDRSRAARDLASFIELDIAFHRALLESSGLEPLVAFGDLLHVFFQRFREGMRRAEWRAGVEGHQRLIDSLREGDVRAACEHLREHIESHKSRL